MAKLKVKPIHFIYTMYTARSRALCNIYGYDIRPIEAKLFQYKEDSGVSMGTFNPKKVTCKKCLKNPKYIEVLDKANHPLFHWKEQL